MRSKIIAVLILTFVTLATPGYLSAAPPDGDRVDRGVRIGEQNLRHRLSVEAARAGVPIDGEEVLSIFHGNRGWLVAPIAGWEQVPATALRTGTDAVFGWIQGLQDVPDGFYTLRAFADTVRPGEIMGRIAFVGLDGQVVAERATPMMVTSMTVPDLPKNKQRVNIVAAAEYQLLQAEDEQAPIDEQPIEVLWIICSNGLIICIYW
jgi:hypothetical protein